MIEFQKVLKAILWLQYWCEINCFPHPSSLSRSKAICSRRFIMSFGNWMILIFHRKRDETERCNKIFCWRSDLRFHHDPISFNSLQFTFSLSNDTVDVDYRVIFRLWRKSLNDPTFKLMNIHRWIKNIATNRHLNRLSNELMKIWQAESGMKLIGFR